MPLASDPRRAHVSHHRSQNSLNIDSTGIHAVEHLFSIRFCEKLDQIEISTIILKFSLLMLRWLLDYTLGLGKTKTMITDYATFVHLGAVHILPKH